MHKRALRLSNGQLIGRPPGEGARYLLTGLLTCAACGAGMEVLSRPSGQRRAYIYRCSANRREGVSICANSLPVPIADADDAVLATGRAHHPASSHSRKGAGPCRSRHPAHRSADHRAALETDLAATDAAVRRLTAAITAVGQVETLVLAVKEREAGRASRFNPTAVEGELRKKLTEWSTVMRKHAPLARQVLKKLLAARSSLRRTARTARATTSSPRPSHSGGFSPDYCRAVHMVASPTGFEPVFWP